MIIARAPLRITFGGGGTDLPSYYNDHEGFLISAAIDKYVYITIHETFVPDFILKYSEIERVDKADNVRHPLVREALKLLDIEIGGLEIASMADIHAGTGLGSSGSFTVALLRALHAHKHQTVTPEKLAEEACHIEIDLLKEPVGKQDQYIAAFGGISCMKFNKGGKVDVSPLNIDRDTRHNLEDNLILFFTGYSRSAGAVLKDQDQKTRQSDRAMIENLHQVKQLGLRSKAALELGDLRAFAALMHEQWEQKKQRSGGMSNPDIDKWYNMARENGALGGKLIGAGGGGFLLFYTEDKVRLRYAMMEAGLREVRWRFDFEGCKIVHS
ncbi:MAG: galactokinase [Alphaproteobacteria bacterium]|nr:galactokinase [Alphaproteobacteria bacterium]